MNDEIKNKIIEFYKLFNIDLRVNKIVESYAVTRYFIDFDVSTTTRIKKIENLVDDLINYLKIKNVRFTNENGGLVFEIPNEQHKTLNYNEILQEQKNDFKAEDGINVCFGKDLNNKDCIVDLTKTPHLLVAGTTGSGKSVFVNSILMQLLNYYNHNDKFNNLLIDLIDLKKVELSIYKDVPNVKQVATTFEEAKRVLNYELLEIEKRYEVIESQNCRNIVEFNKITLPHDMIPYKIVVIDELADLILQDKGQIRTKGSLKIEDMIVRIAQIGRACGVHLIVATQRPSTDIITGLIKANIPSRVAFSVASKIDSKVILDEKEAEKLTGKGDMLFKMVGSEELTRLQGAFVSSDEVKNFTDELRNKKIEADKIKKETEIEKQKNKNKKKEHPYLGVIFGTYAFMIILFITGLVNASDPQKTIESFTSNKFRFIFLNYISFFNNILW